MKTAEQIIEDMVEVMPFRLPEICKPYLIEAMETYRNQPRQNEVSAEDEDTQIGMFRSALKEQTKRADELLQERNGLRNELIEILKENRSVLKNAKTLAEIEYPDLQPDWAQTFVLAERDAYIKGFNAASNVGGGWISKKDVLNLLETQRILELKHNNHSADYAERLLYDLIQEIETLPSPPKP